MGVTYNILTIIPDRPACKTKPLMYTTKSSFMIIVITLPHFALEERF